MRFHLHIWVSLKDSSKDDILKETDYARLIAHRHTLICARCFKSKRVFVFKTYSGYVFKVPLYYEWVLK